MGIRVHKVIGYGLIDLKCKKHTIVDPRINPDGYLGGDWERKENDYTKEGYVKFLNKLHDSIKITRKKDANCTRAELDQKWAKFNVRWELNWFKDGSLAEHLKNWTPWQSVIHQSEYGLPNVLLICPPEQLESWRHYDDTIDYYEENLRRENGEEVWNRYQLLPNGAYPYDSFYIDSRDGRKIKDGHDYKRLFPYMKAPGAKDEAAKKMGFANFKELQKFMKPCVPNSVIYLSKYLKLFKDENMVYSLKPMIYTYWS